MTIGWVHTMFAHLTWLFVEGSILWLPQVVCKAHANRLHTAILCAVVFCAGAALCAGHVAADAPVPAQQGGSKLAALPGVLAGICNTTGQQGGVCRCGSCKQPLAWSAGQVLVLHVYPHAHLTGCQWLGYGMTCCSSQGCYQQELLSGSACMTAAHCALLCRLP